MDRIFFHPSATSVWVRCGQPSSASTARARRVIDAHRLREHERIQRLCREAAFPEADLAADQFYMLLEGAKACVQCIGLKRVGEHLMRSVDALIAARSCQAPPASRAANRR